MCYITLFYVEFNVYGRGLAISLTLGITQLGETPTGLQKNAQAESRVAEAIGGGSGDDDLQARLDSLRR